MRRLAAAFMVLALVCLVGCGGGASSGTVSQANGSSASAGTSNAAATSAQRADRNGFDEAAGTPITIASTQFQLPSYYGEPKTGEDGSATYSAGNDAAIYTRVDVSSSPITGFTEKAKNSLKDIALKGLGDKAQVLNVQDSSIAGKPAVIITAMGSLNSVPVDAKFAFFCDTATNSMGSLLLSEYTKSEYTYFPDFDRMLASAVAVEPVPAEPAATEQAPAADGVSPDVKEALDSYEAFMDEYVDFMQRYNESGNSSQMMVDYLNYLQKYTDLAAKIEKMDTDSMSSADYAYYIEVTSRVAQKLINVSM